MFDMASSADSRMTLPERACPPSGHLAQLVIRAAMSSMICDLPMPGSPPSKVSIPLASRPRHNHSTASGSTSATHVMRSPSFRFRRSANEISLPSLFEINFITSPPE